MLILRDPARGSPCRGILVKGGRVLDALARCGTVAFDKTGTLTTGSLSCTAMRPLGSALGGRSSAAEAAAARRASMGAAVALSLRSSHPVSDAVVLMGQAAGVDGGGVEVGDFELVPGGGVQGVVTLGGGSSGGGGAGPNGASPPKQQQQQQQQRYAAAFGSAEFVGRRLTADERRAAAAAAAGQGASGVLSLLVLEPLQEEGDSLSPGSSSPSSSSSSSGSGSPSGHAGGRGSSSHAAGGGGGATAARNSATAARRSVWVLSFEDSVRRQSAAAVRELQTVRCCSPGTSLAALSYCPWPPPPTPPTPPTPRACIAPNSPSLHASPPTLPPFATSHPALF
jgi:hypothetical protein